MICKLCGFDFRETACEHCRGRTYGPIPIPIQSPDAVAAAFYRARSEAAEAELIRLRKLCGDMRGALIDLQCCPDCLCSVEDTGFCGHKCAAERGEGTGNG